MLTRYRQITLIAVLVSILMLCLTFAYWYKEFNASTEKRQQVFSASCDQTASIIHQRLSRYELMLRGVKGFYESSGFVTRAEYRDYVEALELRETIPGLLGVGVALHVPHEDKDRHLIEMQIRGIKNYQIKPSGVRENYVLISLIEPYVGENLNAMGFDIYSNPATKSALTASQDSGEMALTEMLSLVQDAGKNMPAAVMYIPIYDRSMRVDTAEARRKAILGWVSGPFRINDLISSVGKQLDKDVDIEIYQGDTTSPSNLMYGKHSKLSNLHALRTVDIGGKRWTLAMHASPEFDARFSKSIPSLIAAGGIAFSLLFGWLIWLLGSGQARAVALAREMTDELWIAQKDLECTLNALPDILFELDLQGNYYQLHTSREAFLAAPAEELLGKNVKDVLSIEAANTCLLALKEANETGFSIGKQIEIFVDNESRWFELSVARKDNGVTQTPRFIMISRDITDRKLSSNQLRIAAIAFESQEGMIVTDANHLVLRVNHSYTVITGYSADEVVGKPSKLFSSDRQDQHFYAALWDSINHAGAWAGEISDQRKNGEVYPLHLTITAVKDANNVVTNYVGTMTDITKSKAAIDEINTLAFYDSLTHLPNRRLLIDRLSQALAAHIRNHQIGALLFLDLDHFKTLNDTLGHDLGDLLLQQVAERLVTCIRECDTVARLGGDEFVVLLEGLGEHALSAAARVETIADKILHSLRQPYQLSVHQCHITISIGATLFNEQHFGVDELLKQADIAMYEAKSAGRNTLRFFDPKMQKAIAARVELEQEIRKAIDLQQFRLYYQVQVNDVGHAIGAEVLNCIEY
ncbi:MAG TPA: diguanylate cyclase [Methylotenera sp.]|nr:diguanylate cyclase [Methylotenera sp.]